MLDLISDPFLIAFIAGLFAFLLGLICARILDEKTLEIKDKEHKKQIESEKTELSTDLYSKLAGVRDGLIQTVEAYSAVIKAVDEKLPPPSQEVLKLEENSKTIKIIEANNTSQKENTDSSVKSAKTPSTDTGNGVHNKNGKHAEEREHEINAERKESEINKADLENRI